MITWGPQDVEASQGDNWITTTRKDGSILTAWGDGRGFDPHGEVLSMGFGVIDVAADGSLDCRNITTNIDATGGGHTGIKASGLLHQAEGIYLLARNYQPLPGDYSNARMAFSHNDGWTWQWVGWHWAHIFGCPDFVQASPDPAYAYMVSTDTADAYTNSQEIVLARCPKASLRVQDAWEYYIGAFRWSQDPADRQPVYVSDTPLYRVSCCFNQFTGLYYLTGGTKGTGDLTVVAASSLTGPWGILYESGSFTPAESYSQHFASRFTTSSGMRLVYSGQRGVPYSLTTREAVIT